MQGKLMLCNPEMVREVIYSANSDYSFDNPKFIGAIAQATSQIEAYTRRKLTYGRFRDIYDIPAGYSGLFRLYTSGLPIDLSTEQPSFSCVGNSCPYASRVGSTLNVLDSDLGVLGVITSDVKTQIAISYSAGFKPLDRQPEIIGVSGDYVFLDVPYELASACAVQAAFVMQRNMKNEVGKRGDEGSTVAKEAVYGITPDAAKVVNKYVRPRYYGAR